MIQPRERPTRETAPERPRPSARRRQARSRTLRYAGALRVIGALTIVLGLVMSYLVLVANLTSLNDRIGRDTQVRTALQEETLQLDDRIAHLDSRERLAGIAMKLGMQEPHLYAVVDVGPKTAAARPAAGGIALLGAAADWFKAP